MFTVMNDKCLRSQDESRGNVVSSESAVYARINAYNIILFPLLNVNVCIQELIGRFDEKFSEEEGYSSHSSGNKELTKHEQFRV